MRALQNLYDGMKNGQRIFVWLVSVGLALVAPDITMEMAYYSPRIISLILFIPIVICIYLALGRNKTSNQRNNNDGLPF